MALFQSLTAAISGQVARSAPAILESISRAVHRVVAQLALRIFLAMLLAVSFLAFFSEIMRQIDEVGGIDANARLLGALGLCLLSGLIIFSLSFRPRAAIATRPLARSAEQPNASADKESTRAADATNPPVLRSGMDVLRRELRNERQAFLIRWRSRGVQ